ncbi:MAG: phosphoribosylformylglycinamidine synthase [Fusobacteriaceae bacterium]|nr:phosphoribosylformylglycinamidine synthase [Fusobacteriaceae bacterium]
MNCRIFVEKKNGFDLDAKRLKTQLKESFGLPGLKDLRIFNFYDVFGITSSEKNAAIRGIFSEIVTDNVVENISFYGENKYFAVEYIPGQFDQRADSAMQCLNLISNKNEDVVITSGELILLMGKISNEELDKIKKYYINPIEKREKNLSKLEIEEGENSQEVQIIEGFIAYDKDKLEEFRNNQGLAMTYEDLAFVQKYFKVEEKRNPTETEIKVLDTYWSDHCRHTTFLTTIKNIKFPVGEFGNILQKTFDKYIESRTFTYEDKIKDKKISLMDMGTISGKEMRKKGLLDDLEISDEINACSIYVDVDVDGKIEKWLLMFKNETHNHPTEIEPFGGASTCLGGAIRDPLSGRAYVYQAIRVTGSGNPLEKISDTLEGKLPQRKITTGAARGYSSYGNQIGLTTCHVTEIYHDGYKAKRMEVGAVVGAAPADWIRRDKPKANDVVILIGGKTGRDGCGGATGSSKEHTGDSLRLCGAEVQKGNAPEERKIQRLFRNKEVTRLIKKCNDFGAGGVSVAIGELAQGLEIDLDVIPTKYKGLSGTELAISESQERMAVLVEEKDKEKFIEYANSENLLATVVAKVTDNNRLVLKFKNKNIVDISRNFLDTNGVPQETDVEVEDIKSDSSKIFNEFSYDRRDLREKWYSMLEDLNIASQKGLMDMFDSTIGASTVLMPFGGKYQMTPTDVSIQKLPLLDGETNTCSAITWGYNPKISSWSPYHGAAYAIVENVSKLVAIGGDYKKTRLSFQEYFKKLGNNPQNWGKPFAALLGSIEAQREFGIPSIGGKDSMSGTFNDIHVPPTLISFGVVTVDARDVISPEFKNAGNNIYLVEHNKRPDNMPNFDELKENFEFINENIKNKKIISAITLKVGGIAEALSKMTFGNQIGAKLIDIGDKFFEVNYGSFIVESKYELTGNNIKLIGKTQAEYSIVVGDTTIDMKNGENIWLSKLHPVFPYTTEEKIKTTPTTLYENTNIFICKNKVAKPRVLIATFPGTNCEYDVKRKFDQYGGQSEILVFRNITQSYINDSIDKMAKEIDNSQIFMLPGGFSVGDEPDGSGKFIATVLTNKKIAGAVKRLLKRDGLILGICNGFQALIKSGLLPYGVIDRVTYDSPTITFNKIGRHVSQMVKTKVVSNNSPWFLDIPVGTEFDIPISHGEGRFFASEQVIEELYKNGQIATQYVDLQGNITNEYKYNPNGSTFAVEGILSLDGKILGKMGHSERAGNNLYKNICGNKDQNIFKNGIKYFMESDD